MSDEKINTGYGADSIVEETGANRHRTRISQFLGAADMNGILNQLFEILDNAIDEVTVLYKSPTELSQVVPNPTVSLTINEDESVIVEDRGRGMPCGNHPTTGQSALYLQCESDSAGGKGRGTSGYGDSATSGIHGAGLAVSKSATEYFNLYVKCLSANGIYRMRYELGERAMDIERVGDLEKDENGRLYTGTRIEYKFDETVLSKTLDGRRKDEAYSKQMIIDKLKYAFLGSDSPVEIHFKYKSDETIVISKDTYTPNQFLATDKTMAINLISTTGSYQKANIYLAYKADANYPVTKTIVNRLNMVEKSTTDNTISNTIFNVLEMFFEKDPDAPKELRGRELSRKLIQEKVHQLCVLEITEPKFSGQTKQKLVETRFIPDMEADLRNKLSSSREFYNLIYMPIVEERLRLIDLEKAIEKADKKRQDEKKKKQVSADQKDRLKLLETDVRARALASKESRITFSDSPFPTNQSVLIYVEGKSAGGVLNSIHEKGNLPIAVAKLEGKLPNVTNPEMDGSEITIDNITFCLKAGYKELAILVDGDMDGGHIRLLVIAQILKYAPEYLKNGRVWVIPAPYGSVMVQEELRIFRYGEERVYPIGETQCYSAKEFQQLKNAGAVEIRRFKGLADSPVSLIDTVRNRDKWIRVKPPTQRDEVLLYKVLEQGSDFKSSFMADVFSDRQMFAKLASNTKKEVEINSNHTRHIFKDENNMTTPEIFDYRMDIPRVVRQQYGVDLI